MAQLSFGRGAWFPQSVLYDECPEVKTRMISTLFFMVSTVNSTKEMSTARVNHGFGDNADENGSRPANYYFNNHQ